MAESTDSTVELDETSTQVDEDQATEELAERLKGEFASVFDGETKASTDRGSIRRSRTDNELTNDELDQEDLDEDDQDPEDEEGETDEDGAEDDETSKEDDSKEGSDEAEEEGEEPTLNPVLRRAAQRAGADMEKLDSIAKENPELAENYAQMCLNTLNNLSTRYGQFGETPAPLQQQPAPQPQQQAPAKGADPLLAQIYGDKLESLREKYGPEYFQDIVGPMIEPVRELMVEATMRKQSAMRTEVEGFFKGLEPEFHELYGNGTEVNEKQNAMIQQLVHVADRIRGGAERQGIPLSVADALEQANLMVASENIGKLTMKKIASQVKKRSSQATHRPTHRRRRAAGTERSDRAAQQAYADRAAEFGIDVSGGDYD